MGIGLTPPVAGGFHTRKARIQPVLHEALQDAIFDQDRALGRGAFIINRKRPAAIMDRAVINNRDTRRCNPLTQQTGKGRCALAVEIALKPVADGFMQQNAGPARTKHHGHLARRGGNRFKVQRRLTQRFVNRRFPAFFFKEPVIANAPALAMRSGFHAVALLDDD